MSIPSGENVEHQARPGANIDTDSDINIMDKDTESKPPLPSSQPENGADIDGKERAADTLPPSEDQQLPSPPIYSTFTTTEKKLIVLGAAAGAFFSPLTGQIYFPALKAVAEDLNVTVTQVNLTVTTYLIFQGITPMFIGSFADTTGRRPAYLFCYVVYLGANIGCALAPNYTALVILRTLQSAGASTTVALCQAVVADIITSAERGQYVGWTSVPIILAPSLGPVIGGVLSQYLGWRWVFWFLIIASSVVFGVLALFMPETCRVIVGDGSIRPHPFYRTFWQLATDAWRKRKAAQHTDDLALRPTTSRLSSKKSFHMKGPNPIRTLSILFEKEMFVMLIYSSFIYGGFYGISTALPAQVSDAYGFNDLQIGLLYLALGGGSIVSAFFVGKISTWSFRRQCKKMNVPFDKQRQQDLADFPIEEARLQTAMPALVVYSVVFIGWGWAVDSKVHLAVPIILLFLIGVTLIGFSNLISTLIVDINPGQAGAATAANNLTRCLVGAGASAFINPLINAIGSGWTFTLLGLIFLVFSPSLWFVMKNGIRWRREKLERQQRREAKKKESAREANDEVIGQDVEVEAEEYQSAEEKHESEEKT